MGSTFRDAIEKSIMKCIGSEKFFLLYDIRGFG